MLFLKSICLKFIVNCLKFKREMSTYNLDINQCSKNQFPIELIFIGNQIYKGFVKLAKTTAGIIILIPIGVASIVILPITYILIVSIFTYYLIRINISTPKILKIVVTKDNYENLYNLFLASNVAYSDLKKIEASGKFGTKGLLIKPILFFIRRFHIQVSKVNHHLETQLFKAHNPTEVPIEDVEFFRAQVNAIDHDWDDDEIWKEFQIKHHHLAN